MRAAPFRLALGFAAVALLATAAADDARFADVKVGEVFVFSTTTTMTVEGEKLFSKQIEERHIDAVDRAKGTLTYTVTTTTNGQDPIMFKGNTISITGPVAPALSIDDPKADAQDLTVHWADRDIPLHTKHLKTPTDVGTNETWVATELQPVEVVSGKGTTISFDCHYTKVIEELARPDDPDHTLTTTIEQWVAEKYPGVIWQHRRTEGASQPLETTVLLAEVRLGSS